MTSEIVKLRKRVARLEAAVALLIDAGGYESHYLRESVLRQAYDKLNLEDEYD